MGGPQKEVNFRKFSQELFPIPLDHTSGGDQHAALSGYLVLRRLKDRLNCFLNGALQKSARVNHDEFGLGEDPGHLPAHVEQLPGHILAVNEVFSASEAD